MLWLTMVTLCVLGLTTLAWWRYCHVLTTSTANLPTDPLSLKSPPGRDPWIRAQHQKGVTWLHEIFERSAARYPGHTALQVPTSGEVLTYRELNTRAEQLAAEISRHLTGPDQVVAVSLEQNQAEIVAVHLAILKAGATQLFLDPAAPPGMHQHMLQDADPVLIIHDEGTQVPANLTALNVRNVAATASLSRTPPVWLDEPQERLAALFYTSGTTGRPKGVECAHAGYTNLARSYASYFDFTAGADATSLTSSLGYDGSISELYSAWVFGAAVVLLTKEEVRSGPDLLPILRREEVTALFCPPVLLSTLSDQPEEDLPYPICRYVIPAGEAFPANLVEPWSRARRQIVNTYGPTEASTDTSRQLLVPGKPVTIGTPFPGVEYVILQPETLTALARGAAGELCIGGCHLARGYRNQPQSTADRFVEHPEYGRLYRTGDRCRINPVSGQVEFEGRLDAQLKVRGHRVEAQGIESFLQDSIEDIESAVLAYRNDELVAFVLAPERGAFVPGDAPVKMAPVDWVQPIQFQLRQQFPEHAVPSRLFLVPEFPLKPLSGKIDRDNLPELPTAHTPPVNVQPPGAEAAHPTTGEHPHVLPICQSILGEGLNWDDDFVEWGAHSIAMAKLTQALRGAGYKVSVRDLLTDFRTPRRVTLLPMAPPAPSQKNAGAGAPGRHPAAVTDAHLPTLEPRVFALLQALAVLLLHLPTLLIIIVLIALGDPQDAYITGDVATILGLTFVAYLAYLSTPFLNLAWVLILRTLGDSGSLSCGTYCQWSRQHLQAWWQDRQQRSVLQPMNTWLRAPGIYSWLLRMLGADVGRGTHISQSAEFLGPLSQVKLDDHVVVQSGVQISSQHWRDGQFTIATVSVGPRSKLGQRSFLGPGSTMGADCWLTPLSSMKQGSEVDDGRMIDGVHCDPVGRHTALQRLREKQPLSTGRLWLEIRSIALQFLIESLLFVLPAALIFSGISQLLMPEHNATPVQAAFVTIKDQVADFFISAVVAAWLTLLTTSLLTCTFVRLTAFGPGLLWGPSLRGTLLRFRQEKMNQIQRIWTWTLTGQYLRRLAGVSYGKTGASECDAMLNLVPEMVGTAPNIFMANSCRANVLDDEGEWIYLRPLQLGDNCFLGNNSVAESGDLPDNLLLGVSTPIGDHRVRRSAANTTQTPLVLAGSPPLEFAAPEGQTPGDEKPSWLLFIIRVLVGDLLGIALVPAMPVFVLGMLLLIMQGFNIPPMLSAVLAVTLSAFVLQLLALVVKLCLVQGRWGEDHQTPFWSVRHFTYFLAQDCFFRWAGPVLRQLGGTTLASSLLRSFGCRIGRGSILQEPLQAFDWHAVDIGDHCMIQGQMQLHSFEHRLLTVRRTQIESHSTVNFGATIMGGASLARHTTVDGLGLVMKGMVLSPGLHAGSPVNLEQQL